MSFCGILTPWLCSHISSEDFLTKVDCKLSGWAESPSVWFYVPLCWRRRQPLGQRLSQEMCCTGPNLINKSIYCALWWISIYRNTATDIRMNLHCQSNLLELSVLIPFKTGLASQHLWNHASVGRKKGVLMHLHLQPRQPSISLTPPPSLSLSLSHPHTHWNAHIFY